MKKKVRFLREIKRRRRRMKDVVGKRIAQRTGSGRERERERGEWMKNCGRRGSG